LTAKTDYKNPGSVSGAVVRVWNNTESYNNYHQVTATTNSSGTMTLYGKLTSNSWLDDDTVFQIDVAMSTGSTGSLKVGNYNPEWTPKIYGVSGGSTGDYMCQPFNMTGCTNVKACCTSAGTQCWYEANGKKYMCAGTNCSAAAQALVKDCTGY
jgi:hypothetical protein